MTLGDLLAIGAAVVVVAGGAIETYRDWKTPDEGTTDHAKMLFKEGEIDLVDFQRRVAVYEDPEAKRIRNAVESIGGIDEKTSFDVAFEFDTLDELRDASKDRLMEVPNVGEKRAEYITENV